MTHRTKYPDIGIVGLIIYFACPTAHAATSIIPSLDLSFGVSTNDDFGVDVSVDDLGSIFVAGNIESGTAGYDAFISKFSRSGSRLWLRQLNSGVDDRATSVVADGLGGAYVVGFTEGQLGNVNHPQRDAFIARFDSNGEKLWTKQFGGNGIDFATAVTVDQFGSAYVTGITDVYLSSTQIQSADVFVAKYDTSGAGSILSHFGSENQESVSDILIKSSGNVVVVGNTSGSLDGPSLGGIDDAFLAELSATGDLLRVQQFGSGHSDFASAVVEDGLGGVYVLGSLQLGSNQQDPIVTHFNSSSEVDWSKKYGTSSRDIPLSAVADGYGGVFLAGYTFGSPSGSYRGFIEQIDSGGEVVASQVVRLFDSLQLLSIASDHRGGLWATGTFMFPRQGNVNAHLNVYLQRFIVVSEPNSFLFSAFCIFAAFIRLHKRYSTLTDFRDRS